jgi:D-sedoheptulose 7-phosphate isomerase
MLTRKSLTTHVGDFAGIVTSGVITTRPGEHLPEEEGVSAMLDLLKAARQRQGTVYLVGNGGSAAVASHAATDFFNTGGMRALTLHDPSTLTCFSNDYGYEHAFGMRLDRLLTANDLLIAISSSGQSSNILNAADASLKKNVELITLTGFHHDNPLRAKGTLNYWVNSEHYGMVEIGHLFLLHYIADLLALDWENDIG